LYVGSPADFGRRRGFGGHVGSFLQVLDGGGYRGRQAIQPFPILEEAAMMAA
jgi:hypothetical protein